MLNKLLVLLLLSSVSATRPSGRIVGGITALNMQFPFSVAIHSVLSSATIFCGGALVSLRFVLTAGQCVNQATEFFLYLGDVSLTSANRVTVTTDLAHLHPEFNAVTLENDVALIELYVAVDASYFVKPVDNLPTAVLYDGAAVVTLGWGQTDDNSTGTVDNLRYVYLNTISYEQCRLIYGIQVTENMVCVKGKTNEGTCRGDLGAPLMQYGAGSAAYLVGVSSFISTNGCESTDPSGFTRIAPYVSWIYDILNSDPPINKRLF